MTHSPPSLPSSSAPPPQQPNAARPPVAGGGHKSFVVTWALSCFLGAFGADRFYLGKIGTGIAKLLTFGGFGIWWLVDLVLLLAGKQKDKQGRNLAGSDAPKKMYWLISGVFAVLVIVIGVASPRSEVEPPRPAASAEQSESKPPVSDAKSDLIAVPDLQNMNAEEAEEELKKLGLKADLISDNEKTVYKKSNWVVRESSPAAGEQVKKRSVVTLTLIKASVLQAEKRAAERESAAKDKFEILDMSYDNERVISVTYPVSDAFSNGGIVRNLKQGCVEAIQEVKQQTSDWWEFDSIVCSGMSDWSDNPTQVGSATFTGAQLAEISDDQMTDNPEAFWDMALSAAISQHLTS